MARVFLRMRGFFSFALIGACIFFAALPVFAATTTTDAYDQPSTLTKVEASNHAITFTTASTVSEAATLVLTFDANFTLTSITEDDIDIADDGTDLTTAATCGGTEKASVAVTSTTITITICAGDGGAIASGSVVVIEIGTNAASSGSGANRITNPSAVGTYYINLSGTFGGSASILLPIQNDDDSGVTALVMPSVSSGGGGGSSGGSTGGETGGDTDTGGTDSGETDGGETDTGGTETGGTETGGTDSGGTDSGESTGGTETGGTETGGSTSGGSETTSTDSGSTTGGSSTSSTSGSGTATTADTSSGSDSGVPTITTDVKIITDGGIVLSPSGTTYDVLAGTTATVTVGVTTTATVESVRVDVDGVEYVLAPVGNDVYSGEIFVPRSDSVIDVVVDTVEAPTSYDTFFVDAHGAGLVYENINNSRTPVGGAVVTVYVVVDGSRVPWTGTTNPFVVGTSGSFSFYVPNGLYVVNAGKAGYDDGTTGEVVVTDNILAPTIALKKSAAEVPDAVVPTTTVPTAPASTRIASTIVGVASAITTFIAMPEVQTAADIARPAAAVLAVTSVVVLASSFSLLPFLQYLLTAPALLIARRKRRAFGIVYNAATKLPVDLAIVRLFAMPGHKLLRSVVTDAHGKYLLAAAPGAYVLEVTKQGFASPSEILHGKKDDGTYLDVYTGQEIVVTEQQATIAANIPLDPAQVADTIHTLRAVALRRFLRVVQHAVSVLGIFLAVAVLVIAPSVFAVVMCGVQLFVYLLMRRLARPARAKGWGIVYDEATRQPVGNTVVRLFEPTYNKLVETVLTDRLGRYAFLVGPSEYYVTYSKPGYVEKMVKPIDYRSKAEPTAFTLDMPINAQHEERTEGV